MAASSRVEDEAFVTLATNDTYSLGALVLGHSLRRANTTRSLAVMITAGVSQGMRHQLSEVFDVISVVDVLDSKDAANLDLLTRPDLGVTFTKLNCWRLTQFKKAVFMDADTLAMQNIDELFEREELSAAPDAGWPDCFNSGVFVFKPSEATYQSLLKFAISHGSFDGGDQGLLNLYFNDWSSKDIKRHLPFLYNVVSQAFYSYLPAFKQFGSEVKVVHFIGAVKPWHHGYNTATGQVEETGGGGHDQRFLQLWWSIFMERVQSHLAPSVRRMLRLFERLPPPPSSLHEHYPPPPQHINFFTSTRYEPPSIDVFYEPQPANPDPPADWHTDPNVQDDRAFSHFESFYSEPPMADEDTYSAPKNEVYHAKEFEQQWVQFTEPEEDEQHSEEHDEQHYDPVPQHHEHHEPIKEHCEQIQYHYEPVRNEQHEPVRNEQHEPVRNEQHEPVWNEQHEPVWNEQHEPVQDEPSCKQSGEPHYEQHEPVQNEQHEPVQAEPCCKQSGEPHYEQHEPVWNEQHEPVQAEPCCKQSGEPHYEQHEPVQNEHEPVQNEQHEPVQSEPSCKQSGEPHEPEIKPEPQVGLNNDQNNELQAASKQQILSPAISSDPPTNKQSSTENCDCVKQPASEADPSCAVDQPKAKLPKKSILVSRHFYHKVIPVTTKAKEPKEAIAEEEVGPANDRMGIVGELASLKISPPASGGSDSYSKEQLEDRQRQFEWEQGRIDYLGIDAFAHIQSKLDETIKK